MCVCVYCASLSLGFLLRIFTGPRDESESSQTSHYWITSRSAADVTKKRILKLVWCPDSPAFLCVFIFFEIILMTRQDRVTGQPAQ